MSNLILKLKGTNREFKFIPDTGINTVKYRSTEKDGSDISGHHELIFLFKGDDPKMIFRRYLSFHHWFTEKRLDKITKWYEDSVKAKF
jgi:hypothetical protein